MGWNISLETLCILEKTRQKQVFPKLVPKWKGLYMVVKRFGIVMTTYTVSKLYHFLKLCHTKEFPPWIK